MHRLFTRVRQGARYVFGLLLPPVCPGCGAVLAPTEPLAFCAECYGKMPWWNTVQVLKPELPPAIASFEAACLYDEPLRGAILALKFKKVMPFAVPLAKMLLPLLPEGDMLLLAVPAHPSRTRRRHFNHMVLVARAVAGATGRDFHPLALKRVAKDAPQAGKTRAARLRLPASAFWADEAVVRGREVLLVDDIYTTGATVRACALALKKAGAVRVHVRTLAYTAPE